MRRLKLSGAIVPLDILTKKHVRAADVIRPDPVSCIPMQSGQLNTLLNKRGDGCVNTQSREIGARMTEVIPVPDQAGNGVSTDDPRVESFTRNPR